MNSENQSIPISNTSASVNANDAHFIMRDSAGAFSASPLTMPVVNERLRAMIDAIRTRSEKSDDSILNAARIVKNLRHLVESGELGPNVKWTSWAPKAIGLGIRRLQQLQLIAEAKDPRAALEEINKKNNERVRKFRARERTIEPEKRKFHEWVRTSSLDEINYWWRNIESWKHTAELRKPGPR